MRKKNKIAYVKDVIFVADFKSIIDPIVDKNYKNHQNKEDTQHQFNFKAVPVSEKGVGYLLGKFFF